MLASHSGMQFINGRRQASGERCLASLQASNHQPTGYVFYQATEHEVDLAAQAAAQAFPLYSQTSLVDRAHFLNKIADEIEALDADFIGLVSRETALPFARLEGEKARVTGQMRLFAQLLCRGDVYGVRIDTALPDRQPQPRVDLRQYQTAIGPVAVFGASNFPMAFSTAGGDTAAALAAGCPVVCKAHSGHMATAEKIAEAIERAVQTCNMPSGVFNMIYGNRIGADLVKHPAIKAVGFTGSLAGGRALFDMAVQRPQPIPVFAEMSSINPVIILPHALQTRGAQIAKEYTASFTLGGGQFCTKPGLILGISSPAFQTFIEMLSRHTINTLPQVMLNKSTLSSFQQGIQALNQHPKLHLLAKGEKADNSASAKLYQADVSLLFEQKSILQEEIFGPVSIVVEVSDEAQLIQAIHQLQGQLTATLIGEADELAQAHILSQLLMTKAGRVLVNGYPTGVEVCDAMVHGGPYPATSDARGTSVGTLAIQRFLRPVCFQNYPQALLPPALQDHNPLNLNRLVNGKWDK